VRQISQLGITLTLQLQLRQQKQKQKQLLQKCHLSTKMIKIHQGLHTAQAKWYHIQNYACAKMWQDKNHTTAIPPLEVVDN